MANLIGLKKDSKGEAVVELQRLLNAAGYRVAKDGHLGMLTLDALDKFADEHELRWDRHLNDTVDIELAKALEAEGAPPARAVLDLHFGWAMPAVIPPGVRLIDLTKWQESPIPRSRTNAAKTKTVMRDLYKVTGITLHQMAMIMGVSKQQLAAAKGDRDRARAMRCLGIPAHICVLIGGIVVIHSPLAAYLHHGNEFNSDTFGIEVEGLYAGVKGNKRYTWKPEETILLDEDTANGVRFAIDLLQLNAPNLKTLYAHRQSNGDKTGDPGSELWKVASEHALKYGIRTDIHHTRGDGRGIPMQWDPESPYPYR